MAFRRHLLVVANQTVDSDELHDALTERAKEGPIHVTLLAPTAWARRDDAMRAVTEVAARLQRRGIEAVGLIGDADPMIAVEEAWTPGRYDEVIVSTLAAPVSRWMQIDLPHRVAKLTDAPVRHVEAAPRRSDAARVPGPPPQRRPLLDSVVSLMRTSTRRAPTRS